MCYGNVDHLYLEPCEEAEVCAEVRVPWERMRFDSRVEEGIAEDRGQHVTEKVVCTGTVTAPHAFQRRVALFISAVVVVAAFAS